MLHCVITTIQRPTNSVKRLASRLSENRGQLIIAGDSKGPDQFDLSGVSGFELQQLKFLCLEEQLASGFVLASLLPTKHYCRKNIGYLEAIRSGASCIYETDDDNHPLDHWQPRTEWVEHATCLLSGGIAEPNWVNVYRHFSEEHIWPRGLPLEQIGFAPVGTSPEGVATSATGEIWAPIQQGLADGAPDVDAIWRLVLDREFTFQDRRSACLPPGQWCPFNTQSTWWWPAVYPLLYVPSHCSFRMCDIWKSFVAQRCLWELGAGVVFHGSEVWQARNVHNLMRDFMDEVPGYEQNNRLAEILERTTLRPGIDQVAGNLRVCYEALVKRGVFPEVELELVEAWLTDLKKCN